MLTELSRGYARALRLIAAEMRSCCSPYGHPIRTRAKRANPTAGEDRFQTEAE